MKIQTITDGQTHTVGKLVCGKDERKFKFTLEPTNEGHLMNFSQSFNGTIDEMIAKCREMISGLDKVLLGGTFNISVSSEFYDNSWIVTTNNILNENYEPII